MARAYGSSAALLLKRETTYGTRGTGNYIKMPFTSCNLGSEQGLIDDPVLGLGRDPSQPLLDVINDDGDIVVPVDPRYLGLWLTGIFGSPVSAPSVASGSITFAANPAANATITLNGVVWTFVTGTPTGNQIQIGASVTATIDAAVTALNASANAGITPATYSRPGSSQTLSIVYDTTGPTGNTYTLAASAATVSGATLTGGGNTHTFSSGADTLPSYSLEVGLSQVPAYFMHTGAVFNSIAFAFARSGAATATINAIAQGEKRGNATLGGTPTTLTLSRISQFQGSIRSGGNKIANLTSGSVTYSNNVQKVETIRDDGLIDGADPTVASLTGSIDVRFADTTFIDAATAGTPVDLQFVYTLGAGLSLNITAYEVYLPKPKLAVTGPGGVQATFDFRGARNATAGKMLSVVLVNDLDGTVYT